MRLFLAAALVLLWLTGSAHAQTPQVPIGPVGSGSSYIAAANGGLTLSGTSFSLGDGVGISYTSPGQLALGASASAAGSLTLYNATSGFALATSDLTNVWAQRNGTAAQDLRVYGSYTDASNKAWAGIVAEQTGGSEACPTITFCLGSWHIGTPGGGGSMTNFELFVDGVDKLDYGVTNGAGYWTVAGTGFIVTPLAYFQAVVNIRTGAFTNLELIASGSDGYLDANRGNLYFETNGSVVAGEFIAGSYFNSVGGFGTNGTAGVTCASGTINLTTAAATGGLLTHC